MIKVNKIRKERGITLITLAITVVILIIITTTLATNSYDSLQLSRLTKLENDIKALEDRVAAYYVKYGELPVYGESFTKEELESELEDMSVNDGTNYYIIDLSLIENLTLNYGKQHDVASTDLYIINEESHVIYYLKGIEYQGIEYHTVGKNPEVVVNGNI